MVWSRRWDWIPGTISAIATFAGANLDRFNFTGSDLRGTGVRKAATLGAVILDKAKLDPADRAWLRRRARGAFGTTGVWGQSRWGEATWGAEEVVDLPALAGVGVDHVPIAPGPGEPSSFPWPPRTAIFSPGDGPAGLGALIRARRRAYEPPVVEKTPLSLWRDPCADLPVDALPEMVTLPGGDFRMGAPAKEAGSYKDERPRRRVHVPSFALGRCAVTFGLWDAGAKLPRPKDEGWGRGDRPVINVSWYDAQAYCTWLNGRLGLKGMYRLPTEAEREYACRAGTVTVFSFCTTISTEQANYNGGQTYGGGRKGEYRERTVPVGSLPANGWGLHEMHGNVWEWVEDAYRDSYKDAPLDGSQAVTGDEAAPRVVRGGSCDRYPGRLRSAGRARGIPDGRNDDVGFRLARTL